MTAARTEEWGLFLAHPDLAADYEAATSVWQWKIPKGWVRDGDPTVKLIKDDLDMASGALIKGPVRESPSLDGELRVASEKLDALLRELGDAYAGGNITVGLYEHLIRAVGAIK